MIVPRNGTPVAELRPVAARRHVSRAVLEAAATRRPAAGQFSKPMGSTLQIE